MCKKVWIDNHKDKAPTVVQLTPSGKTVRKFTSTKQAEKFTGIFKSKIKQCINNTIEEAGGFKWKQQKQNTQIT